jgi:hypothetical protein
MDGVHAVAQRVQPGPDPAFDRPEGDTQDDGDLLMGVAAVEGERDGLALQAAQLVQARRELLPVEAFLHGLAHLVPADRDGGVAAFA